MNGHDLSTDHTSFLRSLSPEQRRVLNERADRPGVARLLVQVALMVVLGGVIAAPPMALIEMLGSFWPQVLVGLMTLQGVLIVFLFTLLHEVIHRTAFRSRWLNSAVGWLSGLAIALPPEWFRQFHFAHHRFTHDPDRDPELAAPSKAGALPLLWHVSGIPLWKSNIRTLFRNAAGLCRDDFVPQHCQNRIRWEARVMIGLYALAIGGSLAVGSSMLLWVWVLPALLGQPFLRLYLMAEHEGCTHSTNMFANTRTILTNAVTRWLAWNMPYHAEHHAVPSVPFHRLPALHELTRPHLQVVQKGYLGFWKEALLRGRPAR